MGDGSPTNGQLGEHMLMCGIRGQAILSFQDPQYATHIGCPALTVNQVHSIWCESRMEKDVAPLQALPRFAPSAPAYIQLALGHVPTPCSKGDGEIALFQAATCPLKKDKGVRGWGVSSGSPA